MKHFLYLLFLGVILSTAVHAQEGNIKIGADLNQLRNTQGGFFDYSDPEAVNIKVSVWGFVRYPGRYLVPSYVNVRDLLSYAGGPTDEAHLDDLRLFRVNADSSQSLIKFNYDDLLWGEKLTKDKEKIPNLTVGDVLLVPGAPRFYFRDYFSMGLSVFSALISLGILVLNIARK
ncbi:MAG TPA: SLBB domain-containing protein [Ignavibacteriales bacterium]|nr:SLBB domain-containing protein [Ignavibacteriales bacterium]